MGKPIRITCPECGGRGYIVWNKNSKVQCQSPCPVCKGDKVVMYDSDEYKKENGNV